jgi:hypothetical protein
MLKKTLKIGIVLFFIANGSFAQWSGTTNQTITSGNVGIGTTNPTDPLTVETMGPVMASFKHNGQANSAVRIGTNNGSMNLGVGATNMHPYIWSNTNNFFIGNDGDPILFINGMGKGDGKLGIGTVNPVSKLHLDISNSNSAIPQFGLLIKTASFINNDNAANSYYLKAMDGGNQVTTFIVKGNGSVGIGTENTGTYRLAVNGGIAARGVKVTMADFADYVFEPTYKLRPLSSVESYINENKHLPGMPSAKEVEKEGGFELGNMNVKLLEKIEELTLYVIELKKENEQMKKEIKEIKGKKR